MLGQERHLPDARLQLARVPEEVERAAIHGVVLDPLGAHQVGHHGLAVLAEAELDDRVPPGACRGALAEEPEAPRHERGSRRGRTRIAVSWPRSERRSMPGALRGGPREGMARRDDARIAGARVLPDAVLLLEERDLVPVLRQEVRGRDAGDASSQDEDSHCAPRVSGIDSGPCIPPPKPRIRREWSREQVRLRREGLGALAVSAVVVLA